MDECIETIVKTCASSLLVFINAIENTDNRRKYSNQQCLKFIGGFLNRSITPCQQGSIGASADKPRSIWRGISQYQNDEKKVDAVDDDEKRRCDDQVESGMNAFRPLPAP